MILTYLRKDKSSIAFVTKRQPDWARVYGDFAKCKRSELEFPSNMQA